jgi:hypothetical protein
MIVQKLPIRIDDKDVYGTRATLHIEYINIVTVMLRVLQGIWEYFSKTGMTCDTIGVCIVIVFSLLVPKARFVSWSGDGN